VLDVKFKIKPGHTSERDWMESSPLKTLFWNLTYACNLDCPVCFTDAGRRGDDELTSAEALTVTDRIGRAGVRDVLISGGEPFLRPDLFDILTGLSRHGIALRIATNGTLISDDALTRLKNETLVKSFQVSLETTDAAVYAQVHRTPAGMFDTVKANLAKIQNAGFHTTASVRLMPATLPGLPKVLDLAYKAGWPTVTVHFPVHLGRVGECFPQDEDMLGKLEPAFEHFAGLPSHWLIETYIPWAEYHPAVRRREARVRFVHRGCRAGRDRLTIGPDGSLTPCVCMDVPEARIGNVRTDDLETVFRDATVCRIFRSPREHGLCIDCPHLANCGGGCRAAALSLTGRIDGMDASCPVRKSLAPRGADKPLGR